jgi:SAM-dependent methyltransferase
VAATAHATAALSEMQITIAAAALMQGTLAALIARLRCMASWWLAIQFLCPLAFVALLALHLPSWLFLAAFVVLLTVYWTTFRTQVPFYPSGLAVWRSVCRLLPEQGNIRFVDIGSGLGGMVVYLARQRPGSCFDGIEIAPLPWLISCIRSRREPSNAHFIRADYESLDFASYDVVFAYLSPVVMPHLWRKAYTEMRPGAMLLSYEFAIPDALPDQVIHPREGGPALYLWRF